jgi:hypothetical protein
MKGLPLESIDPAEFIRGGVWQYSSESDSSEPIYLLPVRNIPVHSLDGCLVGAELILNNGRLIQAIIGNLSLQNPDDNQHYLTLSVYGDNSAIFHLSRYHDHNYEVSGPQALAQFLNLSPAEVFPIRYNISHLAKGNPACVSGTILAEPMVRLSRSQLIAHAIS